MKRKDVYLIAIIVFAIALGFAIITGLIYLKRTNQIKQITYENKQNVSIINIRNLYDQYEFITSEGTYYVSKEYHPNLDLNAIEQIDLSQDFDIMYASTELVSLKTINHIVFEIDLVKAKKEARDAFALEAFYWCITICSAMFFLTIIGTKLNEATIKKVEKNILMLPNTSKIKEQLFQYSHNGINFLLLHISTSKSNIIRVYIPVTAENLIRPNNMHTEKIDEQPYCYFDYKLFIYKVTASKLQAKIDSKFKKVS